MPEMCLFRSSHRGELRMLAVRPGSSVIVSDSERLREETGCTEREVQAPPRTIR